MIDTGLRKILMLSGDDLFGVHHFGRFLSVSDFTLTLDYKWFTNSQSVT